MHYFYSEYNVMICINFVITCDLFPHITRCLLKYCYSFDCFIGNKFCKNRKGNMLAYTTTNHMKKFNTRLIKSFSA